MVLCRSKAFNLVALVEFIIARMETYYQSRLVEFANGRIQTQHIMLERALIKCEGIRAENIVMLDENHYVVPSATAENVYYMVDIEVGICTCIEGMFGRFCKHIAAIYKHFSRTVPNLPACSPRHRYEVAWLAYGLKAIPYSTGFYGKVSELENMASLFGI